MKKILYWIFNRYRSIFEDFFIADVFSDIPNDLTEHSLRFLLSGGTTFDKWMRVSSYSLQRKLKQPLKEGSGTIVGGLLFFKTLDVMMSRLKVGERLAPVEESSFPQETSVEDQLRGVDEFFNNHPKKVD